MTGLSRKRMAFTLIELLLVIGILLLLGTVGVVAYTKIKSGSDQDATRVMVNSTCQAVDLFQAKLSRFPSTENGLKELIQPPGVNDKEDEVWKQYGPFLKDGVIPTDPWHNELNYQLVQTEKSGTDVQIGPAYHVWSNGPDGQPGTDDDIRNWTEQK